MRCDTPLYGKDHSCLYCPRSSSPSAEQPIEIGSACERGRGEEYTALEPELQFI